MAKAKFDIKTEIPTAAASPLYAGVGVTDLAVEIVRELRRRRPEAARRRPEDRRSPRRCASRP